MSVVPERPLGRSGRVALVGLFITGTLLASADVLVGIAFAFLGTTTSPSIDMQALARGEPTLIDALNAWVAAWAGYAAFVGFLGAVLLAVVPIAISPQPGIGGPVWVLVAAVGLLLVPVSVGIAVTRYRLYEIDRLISRTIGWALVTSVLLAVFAVVVVGLQAVLASLTQGDTLAVAASTLVASALFQPVRRRVQRAVDRRFDRARYDGERTAAAFAERLRDQVDLTELKTDIAVTVATALRPSSTELWIRPTSRDHARPTTP
jgi:hypothetical protein